MGVLEQFSSRTRVKRISSICQQYLFPCLYQTPATSWSPDTQSPVFSRIKVSSSFQTYLISFQTYLISGWFHIISISYLASPISFLPGVISFPSHIVPAPISFLPSFILFKSHMLPALFHSWSPFPSPTESSWTLVDSTGLHRTPLDSNWTQFLLKSILVHPNWRTGSLVDSGGLHQTPPDSTGLGRTDSHGLALFGHEV